jgi:hypothetical protein
MIPLKELILLTPIMGSSFNLAPISVKLHIAKFVKEKSLIKRKL